MRERLTLESLDGLRRMRDEGLSIRTIADRTGMHKSSIAYRLKRLTALEFKAHIFPFHLNERQLDESTARVLLAAERDIASGAFAAGAETGLRRIASFRDWLQCRGG